MNRSSLLAFALVTSWGSAASAAPIFDPADVSPGHTLIDFEAIPLGTTGPITVGNVTVSSDPNMEVQAYGFAQHPGIYEGRSYTFGLGYVVVEFHQPVAEAGFGVFDPNFPGNVLEAYGPSGLLLESTEDIALFPPGGSGSAFVGIKRPLADIKRLVYTMAPGDPQGIDNIRTYTPPLQVPLFDTAGTGLFVLALAAAGVTFVRRRAVARA